MSDVREADPSRPMLCGDDLSPEVGRGLDAIRAGIRAER
jgi:hypothetical protein